MTVWRNAGAPDRRAGGSVTFFSQHKLFLGTVDIMDEDEMFSKMPEAVRKLAKQAAKEKRQLKRKAYAERYLQPVKDPTGNRGRTDSFNR